MLQCLGPESLLTLSSGNSSSSVDSDAFMHLCPVLIYQLDLHTCGSEHVHEHAHDNVAKSADWSAAQSEYLRYFVLIHLFILFFSCQNGVFLYYRA